MLASAASPQALLDAISARAETVPDQWQVQVQARIQAGCEVVMHTSYLSDADLATAHLRQTADMSATLPARCTPPDRRAGVRASRGPADHPVPEVRRSY